MSNKFTYEGYTLTTQFTNDFTCSMGVSDNITGEFYMNNNVQLTKIKKDTILATLNNKNPKCLKCEFAIVDVEPKKMMVSFIVAFDFLPTFTQYITLDRIQNDTGINKVQSLQIKSDITELIKILESLALKKETVLQETTITQAHSGPILSQQCFRGSYLLEISGYLNGPSSTQSQPMEFIVDFNNQKYCSFLGHAYTYSSYGGLFSVRKELIFSEEGTLKVNFVFKGHETNYNVSNLIVTLSPTLISKR